MSALCLNKNRSNPLIPTLIVGVLFLQVWAPLASAAGMQSCSSLGGECDEYDHAEDMTPNRQDWVEGMYVFDLVSTSSIELELTWAVREFERDSLGLGSGTIVGNTLENTDGLDSNDGAPADLIRQMFNTETGGSGTPTVGQKLKNEVNDAIEDALTSGFGTVTSLSTNYVNQYTNAGTVTQCSTDETTDSAAEGASQDNVFEPPLCFTAVASVELMSSNFNLAGNENLDLERTYKGLLTMGADINTGFELTTQPGHKADFVINPPAYSTVLSVDDNGSLVARNGPPSYWAAEWSMDHLTAQEVDTDLLQSVDLKMGHRNSSGTPTVWVDEGTKALDLNLVLDLRDEDAATIDFVAGLYYLDEATLSDWGVNMFEVSSDASIPLITSDGIRLAYHNGIVDLTQFTDQFPIGDIVEGIGSTVAGVGEITMSDLEWVSESDGTGNFEQPGGLNYSHSTGCSEPILSGQELNYCLEGAVAMDATYPVYLQTTSAPIENMNLISILKEYNTNDMVDDFLDGVQQNDLERLMNSGITLETVLDSSYLDDIIPSNLPPSELTVEILVPSWITTLDGSSKIILTKTIEGSQETDISFTGTGPSYSWESEIKNEQDDVICYANQSTCINSQITLDWEKFNLNEWSQSVSFTFALDAELSIYRIGIPTEDLPQDGDTKVTMEAIPSDLIRLIIDLSSRMEEPLNHTVDLDGDEIEMVATRQGMKDFTVQFGETVTKLMHQAGTDLESEEGVEKMDLSGFELKTQISGIDAPDETISDEEPITLKVSIPRVTFTIGLDLDTEKIQNQDPAGLGLSVVADALTTSFIQPMEWAANALTTGLTNSIANMKGITYPYEFSTGDVNTTVEDDYDLNIAGPISFSLPWGVEIQDWDSTSGNLRVTEDGGRQTITYVIPPGEFNDDISFSIHVSWMYFLLQFWIYPTIVILLLVLFIRRRRRKKKAKKERLKRRESNINKAQLGDHEFSDLVGFSSPGLRRGESIEDMASIDDY